MKLKNKGGYILLPQWEEKADGTINGTKDLWAVATPGPFFFIQKEEEEDGDCYVARNSEGSSLFRDKCMDTVLTFIIETVEANLFYCYKVSLGEEFITIRTNMGKKVLEACLMEHASFHNKMEANELEEDLRQLGYYVKVLTGDGTSRWQEEVREQDSFDMEYDFLDYLF